MKWFKHISDSLDDPVIFDLLSKYRGDGYLVFFGTLEIYAREFKTDDGWKLKTSLNYLKSKLQLYHANRLTIILSSIADLSGWSVNLNGKSVEIHIPKFRKYLDETTLKKLRKGERKSGHIPEPVQKTSPTEVEEEVEEEKKNDAPAPPPSSKHYKNHARGFLEQLDGAAKRILVLEASTRKGFNVYRRVQQQVNKGVHPGAIVKVLGGMAMLWNDIEKPDGYFTAALKSESGNFWEKENVLKHDKLKADFKDIANKILKGVEANA